MGENNNKKSCLLFVVNDLAFFVSHRLPVAIAAKRAGYDVHLAAADVVPTIDINQYGFSYHYVPLRRSSLNPFFELHSLFALVRLFRRLSPALVHLITIKPVLYGGIAARLTGVTGVVVAVSGLGYVFTSSGIRARLIRVFALMMYHLALGKDNLRVVFQNPSDRDALVHSGAVSPDKTRLIRGSGVDLNEYHPVPEPDDVLVVVFASRLLRDKGVFEFVDAARRLKEQGIRARFRLAGDRDPGNPSSVSEQTLDEWRKDDAIEVVGYCRDIPALFAASHIVVLPSYYGEGLPKVLMEAAACGRAVVTTDHPGCRHAVEPGASGLTVPVRDAEALAEAIRDLIENPEKRRKMGAAGRELAEREFSIEKIVAEHLAIYRELLQ